jgi:hypothetical protein
MAVGVHQRSGAVTGTVGVYQFRKADGVGLHQFRVSHGVGVHQRSGAPDISDITLRNEARGYVFSVSCTQLPQHLFPLGYLAAILFLQSWAAPEQRG